MVFAKLKLEPQTKMKTRKKRKSKPSKCFARQRENKSYKYVKKAVGKNNITVLSALARNTCACRTD